ncbi:lipopolysaccharide biosynthesis protein [Thomasclavelia cocleata]|uniref:lipopolysaccharide biosynthesis protein n=2 Tax=Thomasclavelia cocleata TaxID=69824 RepID=UPI002432C30B|nr:oligosaccharide flippase family protein [Thomasclavelia cocleata]
MDSRLKNTVKNSFFAVTSQLLIIVLNFISRSVFIYTLGSEYLGINGLFSNILTMLSLSEMGIGSAIVYNLYKAVNDNDSEKINELMSFYSKIYKIIGTLMLIFGFICSFFIQYLIKDNPFDLNFLKISFLLLVINNASSYFLSYRSCIIFANQKDWICKISNMIIQSAGLFIQILILFFLEDYIIFLIAQIIFTILSNLSLYLISKKMYPGVIVSYNSHLSPDLFEDIKTKVKALVLHSISTAINFGTDNIIISKFVGIVETGLYSNYSMIINTINSFVTLMLNGVTASMGNYIVSNSKDATYKIFLKLNFICQYVYGLCTVFLFCLLNRFVDIWTGSGNNLNFLTVFLLVVNFYVLGVRQSIMITRNAGGLYVNDQIVAIIKPIINLFFSIFFVIKIGLSGVFIGTLISQVMADIILYPYILLNKFFRKGIKEYFIEYFKFFIIVIALSLSCYYLGLILEIYMSKTFTFIVMILLCLFIYNLIIFVFYKNSNEFKYIIAILKNLLLRR